MCGITGFVDFSTSRPNSKTLDSMLSEIIYRGPDSLGHYIDKYVALGIRRLSVIDLESGDQPISNEDGSVTVVFNGEIYNFQQLRSDLEREGHKFKTNSDTEVLVHLYEKYGEQAPTYLNGMFAFAIWDKKKEKVFIARDHAGIKPLYFYCQGENLVFGSEPKTILKNPLVKRELNIKALGIYAYLGYVPGQLSIFKDIQKLLPGHSLTFSNKGLRINKYYNLKKNEEDLGELFSDAVKLQLIADVPLGVFLSGGLDSSLITYYLTKKVKKVKTFSISFSEKSFDEGNYAKIVAKHFSTDHYTDYFEARDVLELYPHIISKLDEPLADPSLFPTYKVSKFARKQVKVVLSGDGGDELFGGYPTYQGHILASNLGLLSGPLKEIVVPILNRFSKTFENYSRQDILGSFLLGISKPALERHLFWMSLFSLGQDPSGLILSKQDFLPDTKGDLRFDFLKDNSSIILNMQMLDFHTYLPDDLLVKVDRAAMYNSLEVRVPFLDPRIIDYAYSNGRNHVDLFATKKILRKLLKDKLPEEIINRKKKGFGIPIAKWINGELEDFTTERLSNKRLYQYFKKDEVWRLLKNHQERRENNAKILWMLVILSGFLEQWDF